MTEQIGGCQVLELGEVDYKEAVQGSLFFVCFGDEQFCILIVVVVR